MKVVVNSGILIAIITALSMSLSSPVMLMWYQNRIAKRVAAQAAEAARLLLESNKRVAAQADRVSRDTVTRLDAIHTLVNSSMTSALEGQLEATRASLTSTRAMLFSMREVISLKEDRGIPVTQQTRDAIVETETQISELAVRITVMADDLDHRQQQTDIADAELRRRGEAEKR